MHDAKSDFGHWKQRCNGFPKIFSNHSIRQKWRKHISSGLDILPSGCLLSLADFLHQSQPCIPQAGCNNLGQVFHHAIT